MRPTALVGALLVVAIGAAILLGSGVLGRPSASPTDRATPDPTATAIATPTARPTPPATPKPSATPIDTSVRASAIVVPRRSADLALPVGGVVEMVLVAPQELVIANRALLRLNQSTYLAAIDVAEADVRRAEAALDLARLQVDQLPPDATPGQVESAQAEMRLAEAELELARSTLSEALIALRQTELRAPFTGTVAAVSVEPGEQAAAGAPLVTIGDLTGWFIETTDVSELEVVRIAVGDPATITIDALPDLVLTGRVERIQVRGTTDDGGVMFAVAVRPDEHHPVLRWNMSATVRITPSG